MPVQSSPVQSSDYRLPSGGGGGGGGGIQSPMPEMKCFGRLQSVSFHKAQTYLKLRASMPYISAEISLLGNYCNNDFTVTFLMLTHADSPIGLIQIVFAVTR